MTDATGELNLDIGRFKYWMDAAVKVLPAAGIALFALLAVGYNSFYAPLGADPGAVGLGYVDALAGGWATALFLVVLLPVAVLLGSFYSMLRVQGYWMKRVAQEQEAAKGEAVEAEWYENLRHQLRLAHRRNSARNAFILMLVAALILMEVVYSGGHSRARQVAAGHSVGPLSIGPFTVLLVRADPVKLVPSSGQPPLPVSVHDTLLYLGTANDTFVLYDVTSRGLVRVNTLNASLITG
jgi:hypothetical protein